MAILRGGKRIGGYDIRIGLPRDRSLDDVQSDPRLRQKAGGNPETTMGRFQAMVNEAEGFQRKARFYVEFALPRGSLNQVTTQTMEDEQNGFSIPELIASVNTPQTKRRVQAFCSAITMPSREAVQKEIISFLRITGKITPDQLRDEFVKLYNRLLPLNEDIYERRPFFYLDILSYLESKIENRPVHLVIQEKFEGLK